MIKQEGRHYETPYGFANERYDLSMKVTNDVTMSRGKPLPVGPTARLKDGMSWEKLSTMTPEDIKEKNVFPYLPLPIQTMPPAGCCFLKYRWKNSHG
nr:hypothetical protein [Candidatus Kuenenia stuttgartiensis]